jgi:hypothetical protein
MNKNNVYTILNIVAFVLAVCAAGVSWFFWKNWCTQETCDVYFILGTLKPIYFGTLALSIILGSLLPLSSKMFKHWLLHIASWSIVIAVILVIQEDPRSSNILSVGRGLLSWALGTFIFVLTALYALIWHFRAWKKGTLVKKDLAKLLVFIPATAIFYAVWQFF